MPVVCRRVSSKTLRGGTRTRDEGIYVFLEIGVGGELDTCWGKGGGKQDVGARREGRAYGKPLGVRLSTRATRTGFICTEYRLVRTRLSLGVSRIRIWFRDLPGLVLRVGFANHSGVDRDGGVLSRASGAE